MTAFTDKFFARFPFSGQSKDTNMDDMRGRTGIRIHALTPDFIRGRFSVAGPPPADTALRSDRPSTQLALHHLGESKQLIQIPLNNRLHDIQIEIAITMHRQVAKSHHLLQLGS